MGNINIQTLTLLATIIGVASNLLSISQNLRKNGVIAMLKGLSLCVLPVLFIQQIILITNAMTLYYNGFILIVGIFLILFIIISNKQEEKKTTVKEIIFPLVTVAFISLFEFQPIYINVLIKDYNNMMNNFIMKLSKHKISIDMFMFLSDNLNFAIYTIIDIITVFVLSITYLYTFKYFLEEERNIEFSLSLQSFEDKDKGKYFVYLILSFFLSSGIVKCLIQSVLNLF